MAKRLISAICLLVLLTGAVPAAQRPQVASEQEQWILGEYWAVVKKYQAGQTAAAIKEMSSWPQDRVAMVQATQFQPESALNNLLMSKTEWKPASLRAAAMLHTEVGLGAVKRNDLVGFQFHAGIADGWLHLADDKRSAPGGLRSRWNVAVARVLLLNKESVAAEAYLDRLNTKIANDPAVLLALGTARESRALRLAADAPASERDALRAAAATHFERALAMDATLVEARLRLARLALDRGDDAAAEKHLAAVKVESKVPGQVYLANLWLGQIRERQKPWTAAAELYVEAIKTQPDAKSAYVALSEVLRANGEPVQSAGVMDRFQSRGVTSPIADPMTTYPLGLDTFLEARFDAIFKEVTAMKDAK
jgi:tetratricopeptide (TPR) repeat protein